MTESTKLLQIGHKFVRVTTESLNKLLVENVGLSQDEPKPAKKDNNMAKDKKAKAMKVKKAKPMKVQKKEPMKVQKAKPKKSMKAK
jgi:hypothetical protein